MDEYIKGWLNKAARDIMAVEHEPSLERSEWLTDVICFHCHSRLSRNILRRCFLPMAWIHPKHIT